MDYMLKRWPALTRFLDDGRICFSNNAAERALRGIALGRHAWLFAGSDRGGERAAAMYRGRRGRFGRWPNSSAGCQKPRGTSCTGGPGPTASKDKGLQGAPCYFHTPQCAGGLGAPVARFTIFVPMPQLTRAVD